MSGSVCPRCGSVLARNRRGAPLGTLELYCPRCRYLMFDYPRPCAGMLVVKAERVLMLRRGHPPRRGWLDLPGGFMEAREDMEVVGQAGDGSSGATLARELRPDVALAVGRARALGFYWDRYFLRGYGYFPTMNFYYLARWRSGEPRAADDAAAAEWVELSELGRRRARFAWRHMSDVFRDLRRAVRGPR